MILPILALGVASFVIAWLATLAMIRVASRLGLVDKPGGRKIHAAPKPLGGGVAIVLGFAVPLAGALLAVNLTEPPQVDRDVNVALAHPYQMDPAAALEHTSPRDQLVAALWRGARQQTRLGVGLLLAIVGIHALGLIDDRRALGPFLKLFVQLAITIALVAGLNLRAL